MSRTDIEVLRHDEHRRCHTGACCCGFCGSEPVDGTNTQSRSAEPLKPGFCSSEPIPSADANSIYDDCGTYAAVQRHQRYGTPVCGPCSVARNAYMKNYRAKSKKHLESARDYDQARRELARRHHDEYKEILAALREDR